MKQRFEKQKPTHFRTWKSGKKWLFAASAIVALAGAFGAGASTMLGNAQTTQAAQTTTNSSSDTSSTVSSTVNSSSSSSTTSAIVSSSAISSTSSVTSSVITSSTVPTSHSVTSSEISAQSSVASSVAASTNAMNASSASGLPAGLQSAGDVHRTSEAQSAWNSTNNTIWSNIPSTYNIKNYAGNTISIGDAQARAIYGTDYNYAPVESPETLALMGISMDQVLSGLHNLNVSSTFENNTLTFTHGGKTVYHVDAARAVGFAQSAANLEMAQLKAGEDVNSYYQGNSSVVGVNDKMMSAASVSESLNAKASSLIAQGKLTEADSVFAVSAQQSIQVLEGGLGKNNNGKPTKAYLNAATEAAVLVNAADVAKQMGLSDDVVGSLQLAALDANNWMIFFAKDYFSGSGFEPVAINYDMSLLTNLVDQGKLPQSVLSSE